MNSELTQFVEGTAQLMTNFFNISLLAAKRVSWLTVKEWQAKTHNVHKDLLTMNKTNHNNAVKEMFDIY